MPKSKKKIERGNGIRKYFSAVEIGQESIKIIDAFLVEQIERLHQKIALAWFNDNEEKIKSEGTIIPQNASDEWKISLVIGAKNKGGLGMLGNISGEKYKKFLAEVNFIKTLRVSLKKDKISIEVLFLLLNSLQIEIENEENELAIIKENLESGSRGLSFLVNERAKHLEKIYLTANELASKVTGENLDKIVEQRIVENGFESKGKRVEKLISKVKGRISIQKNNELLDKEWQEFDKLTNKQKSAFFGVGSQQVITNKGDFQLELTNSAEKNGVDPAIFCSFLAQGYKPHQTKVKGIWFLGTEKVAIPKSENIIEIPLEEYDNFVERVVGGYEGMVESMALKEIESAWEEEYHVRSKNEKKKYVAELARSIQKATIEARKIYQKARSKVIEWYIKKQLEQNSLNAIKVETGVKKIEINKLAGKIKALDLSTGQTKLLLNELAKITKRGKESLIDVIEKIQLVSEEEDETVKNINKYWREIK